MSNFLQRHQKALLHVGFWLTYITYFFYLIAFGRREEAEWSRIIADVGVHVVSLLIICYVNYFFFLPRLLRDGRVGRYLLTFGPVFIILCTLTVVLKRQVVMMWVTDYFMYSPRFILHVFVAAFFVTGFVSLIRFFENYSEMERRAREMENRQLTSELRFLKAQINPHFLFNTLNNLYYLAVNNSEQTPEVIAKLSGMMRYMIHESNTEKVALAREVEYMENYLDLERLRLNEEVPITFEVEGDVTGTRITPLILITFLENAFKHGIGNAGGESWITVSLEVIPPSVGAKSTGDDADTGSRMGISRAAGRVLYYKVANSAVSQTDKTVREASGIGLANVRRRLDLSYPDAYELNVEQDEERYVVQLKINL
ncbi:sensor histidine kinase [Lewinellaceae bacterium SD302]|nr:sensor histidine kinase [Lewinellaceae bacterium SD302]